MKRETKNILSIALIITLIFLMVLTVFVAKYKLSSSSTQTNVEQISSDSTSNMNPPTLSDNGSRPNGEMNSGDTSNVPDKPEGETSSNMTTTPDKSEGETSGDMTTPPDKPDGETSNSASNMPDMSSTTEIVTSSASLTLPYYIALAVESLILCSMIIYLIQSNFNMKNMKETYIVKDKLVIGILLDIILTTVLTFGISYLTNNVILKSSTSSNTNSNQANNMGGNSSSASYSSSNEITSSQTISNEEYTSTSADENALSVSGDIEVTGTNITVTKSGDSDGGDNTSFYGINSAIIAKDGAKLTLKNITVTTSATGANGVFSYGGSATTNNSSSDGTTINISDSTITTTKDNSGGIMTTGGGITNASNLTIETSGTSSAAIRTDRGGGTVNVDGGTYKTTGKGSPTIYSTANITVKNASLIATASEGIVIEGKNSVSIDNVNLVDTNSSLNGQSTTYKNIFLYQSMSGDADTGISEFSASNSTITTNKGDSFYITNTTSKITLINNTIINNDSAGNFLRAKEDSWGTSGSNGGIVTLVMNKQTVSGNIVIDSSSTLDMQMSESSYTGTINSDNTAKNIKITLDKDSKITLTGNSYITELDNTDTTNSNINFNGYKLYVNGVSIN